MFNRTEVTVIIVIIALLLLTGCGEEGPSETERFFGGEHPLLKISEFIPVDDSIDISTTPNKVAFMWENSKGHQLLGELPYSKVRFSDEADPPYCKFRWNPHTFLEGRWVENVVYIVIFIRKDQIPEYLNIR